MFEKTYLSERCVHFMRLLLVATSKNERRNSVKKMQVSLFVSSVTSRSRLWHRFFKRRLCPTAALSKGDFWTPVSWNTWRWKRKGILVNNLHLYVHPLLPLPSHTCGITNWDLSLAGIWIADIYLQMLVEHRKEEAAQHQYAAAQWAEALWKQDCPPGIKEKLWIGVPLQYKLLYFYV